MKARENAKNSQDSSYTYTSEDLKIALDQVDGFMKMARRNLEAEKYSSLDKCVRAAISLAKEALVVNGHLF